MHAQPACKRPAEGVVAVLRSDKGLYVLVAFRSASVAGYVVRGGLTERLSTGSQSRHVLAGAAPRVLGCYARIRRTRTRSGSTTITLDANS
ncbi:MAG TPA: hypothetical protein VHU80_11045 [Polyangiaceae bacterium]|jgi:hypothetical protein|nr:hypothetical protein [Polyangiaceae bacterium]